MTITYDEFAGVEIRVGTVVNALPFPEARHPVIKLWVDFGPALGIHKSSAQLTRYYAPETLRGRQMAAVMNSPPRQSGPLFIADDAEG